MTVKMALMQLCFGEDRVWGLGVEDPVQPKIERRKIGAFHEAARLGRHRAEPTIDQTQQGFLSALGLSLGLSLGLRFSLQFFRSDRHDSILLTRRYDAKRLIQCSRGRNLLRDGSWMPAFAGMTTFLLGWRSESRG